MLSLAINVAIGFLIAMALGLSKFLIEKKQLIKFLQEQKGEKVLYTHDLELNLEQNLSYKIIKVTTEDLTNSKSIVSRLMKKTGVQSLPCAFSLNENKEIVYEIIK
ncbi:hypothetical protein [Aureivirga sp. CE67]|uniref:hypothetical protein n=1 Tax=Aureivirga sp. CE67 TaxID=1788983 RepID=UPI0018CB1580|nr:hypothetical protein [Aureivirga sp. CE67]